jgi:phosphoglucosamine mutase
MEKYPQKLINVRFNAENDPIDLDSVKQSVADAESELGEQGRVLLRKSGTEPVIRVMVEAQDSGMANNWAEYIATAVKEAI